MESQIFLHVFPFSVSLYSLSEDKRILFLRISIGKQPGICFALFRKLFGRSRSTLCFFGIHSGADRRQVRSGRIRRIFCDRINITGNIIDRKDIIQSVQTPSVCCCPVRIRRVPTFVRSIYGLMETSVFSCDLKGKTSFHRRPFQSGHTFAQNKIPAFLGVGI